MTKISSHTSQITIAWTSSVNTEISIQGYKVYLAEYDLSPSLVYDGSFNNLKTQITISKGIRPGVLYKFYVTAINYNGESSFPITPLTVFACGNPSQPLPPYKVSGDQTSLTLGWVPPSSDGGCPIIGYKLLTDGGSGGALNIEPDITLETNPYVFTLALSTLTTGIQYRF